MVASDVDTLKILIHDIKIWQYVTYSMQSYQDIVDYVNQAISQRLLSMRYHFIIEDVITDEVLGSTALCNYSTKDHRIEIGWSFLKSNTWGSGTNKQVKFLLLDFAFTQLNANRVEFKTDVLNLRARSALLKIGTIEEGTLRSHTLMPSGRYRDTIYYSILKEEWPEAKAQNFAQ